MGMFQKKAPENGCPWFPYFHDLGTWRHDLEDNTWTLFLHETSCQLFGFRTNAGFRQFADMGGDSSSNERDVARQKRTHIEFAIILGPDIWFLCIEGPDGPKFLAERLDSYWRNVIHADKKFDLERKRLDSYFDRLPMR